MNTSFTDKSKYSYEISNYLTQDKCRCGLNSSRVMRFPDGKEIAVHVTLKSVYWHITYPGQKPKRVFKCPKEFNYYE